jgi:hypothetical protein
METNATQLLPNNPPALTTRASRGARLAWLSLAALAMGVFLSSLPGYLQFTRQGMHHQPATDSFNALSAAGLHPGFPGVFFSGRRNLPAKMG